MTEPDGPVPSEASILQRFAALVGASLRIDPARVTPESRLDELGAESLDLVEITLDVENEFSILMPERTILEAATEELGEGVFEQDGLLTQAGKRLLLERLPGADPAAFDGDQPVREVRRLFLRVDAWVALIRRICECSPRTCGTCGAALVQGSPGRLRCRPCGREYDLPAGDEVNRAWVRQYAGERGLLRDPSGPPVG
jgi:acyl carrier protein